MKIYEIRDPVYGFIKFNEWERQIIDHPAFQRLRRIRQLALTDMVYPGAMHTRFEHSLGVMHLATLMFDAIVSIDNNKKILEEKLSYNETGLKRDRQLIRLAALLHDVGHASFSHSFEEIMPTDTERGRRYKHEDYTTAIIRSQLKNPIENHQINKTNLKIRAEEVAALIEGNVSIVGERIFWKVIISSQLDADRGDYLLRDSHHIGVKYGVYDHSRLLNTLALGVDPESKEVVLGVDEGGWHVAESIVIARYLMFTQVYFHKTRRAYDYHLQQAMKAVLNDNDGELPSPKEIDRFLDLDDIMLWRMFRDKKEDFDCESILRRNHIREIHHTFETPTESDEKKKEDVKRKLESTEIWFHEDKAERLWYELNKDEKENKEIMIITNGSRTVRPLSEFSCIARNMGGVKQIRIYVKPEDKKKAEEAVK